MAKLSAYGQREVVRASKEFPGKPDGRTIKELRETAVMHNGRGLERLVVWFAPGPYEHGKPQRHDYGWKLRYRNVQLATVAKWAETLASKGWTITRGPAWYLVPAAAEAAPAAEGGDHA